MTAEGFETYLWVGAAICLVLAILNLAMVKKRGRSAIIMAAASLDVGVAQLIFLKLGASPIVYVVGAGALGLLVYHALLVNAENQAKKKSS